MSEARVAPAPASRIVRIASLAWPIIAAATILATVALAIPHDAWLPFAPGPALPADWERPGSWPVNVLARAQVALGRILWPSNPIAGGIEAAAALAASTAAVLAVALRTSGLTPSLAALLGLVAASAPLAGWQASSPLGAAPLGLATAIALWRFTGHGARRWPRARRSLVIGVLTLAAAAAAVVEPVARTTPAMASTVMGDLGWPGLALASWAVARGIGRPDSTGRSLVGLLIVMLLSAPLAGTARAALVLPWAWWLAGAGLADVLQVRGASSARWAAAGLLVWIGLHAAQVPWGRQRQQAALTRTWAEGIAARADVTHPLVEDGSARGVLLTALVRQRTPASASVIGARHAWAAAHAGRQPLVTHASTSETLRWSGLGFALLGADAGSPVDRVLDAMPEGTVALAVISADAASRLTPAQWQSLGRIGLRLADAGTARAHVLVGVTGARVDGLEAARQGAVRLDVQPGDPLGRTGVRSPVDARLEAGQTRVSVWLRGSPVIEDADGLALLLFSRRGDLLATRVGHRPNALAGPSLGSDPDVVAVAIAALPCLDARAGATDITPLTTGGALGLTSPSLSPLDVSLTRPAGLPTAEVRIAGGGATPGVQASARPASAAQAVSLAPPTRSPWGLYLRGPVDHAEIATHQPVRVCAAWPMPFAVDPGRGLVKGFVSPRFDPHFGFGWHDSEVDAGTGYFRWMSGPRAELLIAIRDPTGFTLSIDAQGPDAPQAGDEVRLEINGRPAGTRPLLPTRGIYAWDIAAADVRQGMNRFVLATTRTLRPADRDAGRDARLLGLLVRQWTLAPPSLRE